MGLVYAWLIDGYGRVWLLVDDSGQGQYRLAEKPRGSTPVPGEEVSQDFGIVDTGPKVMFP